MKNVFLPTHHAGRLVCSSIAILLAVLILALSQFGDSLAQPAPIDTSRPVCMQLDSCSFDSRGLDDVVVEAPVDTSQPACMQLDSCSFDSHGLDDVEDEESIVVARPACVIANVCFMLP